MIEPLRFFVTKWCIMKEWTENFWSSSFQRENGFYFFTNNITNIKYIQ